MATAVLSAPLEADPPPALRLLIEEQARDDRTHRLHGRRHEVGGLDLDRIPARRRPGIELIVLTGPAIAWVPEVQAAVLAGRAECPVCRDRPTAGEICSYCDRSGLDGRIDWPGFEVGEWLDPDYVPDRPAPERGRLAGGTERARGRRPARSA